MKAVAAAPSVARELRMKPQMTDEQLLEDMAEHGTREAFQILFERHGRAAYRLARYLTHDDALAEDTVQEAMLNVWTRARQYNRARGNARAWILRIVANKALACTRRRRRKKQTALVAESETVASADPAPEDAIEKAELSTAVRQQFERLPAPLARIMSLYYLCELKQAEIARMLSMPPRTVSHRIEEGLTELRRGLELAGFAAAVPLLKRELLADALLGGGAMPGHLTAKVLSTVAHGARESMRAGAAASAASGKVAAVAVACLLVAGATAYALYRPEAEPKNEHVAASPATTAAAAPKTEPLHRHWSFAKGPAPELTAVVGEWQWVPANGGRPAGMATGIKDVTAVILPVDDAPGKYWKVTLTAFPVEGDDLILRAERSTPEGTLINSYLPKGKTRLTKAPHKVVTYVMGEWEVSPSYQDGSGSLTLRGTTMYQKQHTIYTLIINVRGHILMDLDVQEITRDQIPDRFAHPEKLVSDLKLQGQPVTSFTTFSIPLDKP